MKPLTTAEMRAYIAARPASERPALNHLAFSAYDEGTTAGLAGAARALNPFLPAPAAEKPKGKAR